jgi:hypothetical protein
VESSELEEKPVFNFSVSLVKMSKKILSNVMRKFFTFEELVERKKKVDDYQKRLMSPLMPRGRLTP